MDAIEQLDREPGTASRFNSEVKRSTRTTGIAAAAIAAAVFPAWAIFDRLVEPANADAFLELRLLLTVPIVVLGAMIALSRLGHSHPELLLLAIMAIVNFGIAIMLSRLDSEYAAYSLGMSLTIYGGASLLIWSPAYMGALVGITATEIAAALLLSDPVPSNAVATIVFYVGTASALGLAGQLYRHRLAWSEFEIRAALELEQRHSSELVAELDRQSHEDALTGLANRRAWDKAIDRECARSARERTGLAVLLCDLDGLKEINDQLGHPVGDIVLKTVGNLLRDRTRAGDLVARIGGDEFAILSSGSDVLGATELAEHLRRIVADESTAAAGIGGVTISIGVADREGDDDSPETLMLRADRRLYTAKATRNVVCAGDPPRHV